MPTVFKLLSVGGARGVPIMTVRGVAVEAHWSLALLAVYFPYRFAWVLRSWFSELSATAITALAFASAALVVGSVLLHEFGHVFQARREGMAADRVILWGLGGLALTGGFGRTPGADFRMTAAGPGVSLLLAAATGGLAWLADGLGAPSWLVGLLVIAAVINAGLLAFNVLPAYPLDGGRMLHAALWRLRGFAAAAPWTTRVGLAIGGVLLVLGIVGPFVGLLGAPFSAGYARRLDGVSLMVVGGILLTLAYTFRPPSELRQLTLRGRQVGDLLQPTPVMPEPGTSVSAFLDRLIREGGQSAAAYPVVDDGRVLGVISPGLAAGALDEDPATDVCEVMVRKEDALILRPEMSIPDAFAAFRDDDTPAVVIYNDLVVGILRKSDLAGALLEEKAAEHGSVVPAAPARPRVDW